MLETKNLCFSVEEGGKRKSILKDISLVFDNNQFVVITGPNGSGKSTFVKCLMGIVAPSKGKILFDGEDITSLDITNYAKNGISFSFQQPVKIKGIKVRDLLEIAGAEKPAAFLEMVGLSPEEYLEREISGSLSGGELKRIEIASVLARNSKVMIFDEPEAGIDLWSFNDLVNVFKKAKKNHTLIIISHQERIIKIADRVIVFEGGRVKRMCTPDEFIKGVK